MTQTGLIINSYSSNVGPLRATERLKPQVTNKLAKN